MKLSREEIQAKANELVINIGIESSRIKWFEEQIDSALYFLNYGKNLHEEGMLTDEEYKTELDTYSAIIKESQLQIAHKKVFLEYAHKEAEWLGKLYEVAPYSVSSSLYGMAMAHEFIGLDIDGDKPYFDSKEDADSDLDLSDEEPFDPSDNDLIDMAIELDMLQETFKDHTWSDGKTTEERTLEELKEEYRKLFGEEF